MQGNIIDFNHGLPCYVENMARGTQVDKNRGRRPMFCRDWGPNILKLLECIWATIFLTTIYMQRKSRMLPICSINNNQLHPDETYFQLWRLTRWFPLQGLWNFLIASIQSWLHELPVKCFFSTLHTYLKVESNFDDHYLQNCTTMHLMLPPGPKIFQQKPSTISATPGVGHGNIFHHPETLTRNKGYRSKHSFWHECTENAHNHLSSVQSSKKSL